MNITSVAHKQARSLNGILMLLVMGIGMPALHAAPGEIDRTAELREALDASAPRPARQLVVDVQDVMSVILEEGDELKITVLGDPVLSMEVAPVNKGGSILHPVLKELKVAGKTLKEAQQMIHDILAADYLVNPSVTLTITKYATYEFSVMDEVIRPGTYSLTRDKKIDISQAVAMAGGPTRVGSSKVVVERLLETGERKVLKVDTSKPNNEVVQPDDRIKVGEKFW
jgi:polysaccharide export outer membrane protein